jgi:hypothetical protein
MGWSEELGRLGQEIMVGFDARVNERRNRQATVSRFLSETQVARHHAFHALHQQMVRSRQERHGQVVRLRRDATAILTGYHQERARAHAQWNGLEQALARKRAGTN